MGQLEERHARIEKRNEDIRAMHHRLSEKKVKNKRLYSQEYIISEVAEKFYMSERTIEDIVFNRFKFKSK